MLRDHKYVKTLINAIVELVGIRNQESFCDLLQFIQRQRIGEQYFPARA